MDKIKCITFDKAAQDALPEHIKVKMKADSIFWIILKKFTPIFCPFLRFYHTLCYANDSLCFPASVLAQYDFPLVP